MAGPVGVPDGYGPHLDSVQTFDPVNPSAMLGPIRAGDIMGSAILAPVENSRTTRMPSPAKPTNATLSVSGIEVRAAYRRVVVKAGTTLLTHGAGRLNLQVMATLVEQMAGLHRDGVETLLVSSGAVASGRHVLGVPREGRNVPFKQVLAAAGQGRLMHAYEQLFDWHQIPVAQALLTRNDLSNRHGYLNVRNTLLSLIELRVIPIINENDVVAVDELAGEVFGDNDSLSSMVANLVDADLLIMLGEIKGLYTADPHLDADAKLIPLVDRLDGDVEAAAGTSWRDRGQGGMATKLEAAGPRRDPESTSQSPAALSRTP